MTKNCWTGHLASESFLISRKAEQNFNKFPTYRLLSKGDLVNWDTSTWKLSHMQIIEKSQDEVCLLPQPRDIVFPEKREASDMHLLCNKLKGTMSVTDSQETQDKLVQEFTQKMPDEYNEYGGLTILLDSTRPKYRIFFVRSNVLGGLE